MTVFDVIIDMKARFSINAKKESDIYTLINKVVKKHSDLITNYDINKIEKERYAKNTYTAILTMTVKKPVTAENKDAAISDMIAYAKQHIDDGIVEEIITTSALTA